MIPLILLGAVALGAAVTVAVYWKEISAWMSRIWEKLPASVKTNLQGALAFVQKVDATFKNLMIYYSYDHTTEKWTETAVSKEVSENDIPEHIRKRVQATASRKIDISDELEKQLLVLKNS